MDIDVEQFFTLLTRVVDLIRWKKIVKNSLRFIPRKSNFSSLKMFYAAIENEHLTNCYRIQ